ncbi:MAG: class I SAM-dependent methyltransferase [Desulfobacca sp.]|nr:class I SAM-dependent methyltransferase [Desulfobacca sp.]
MKNSDVTMSTGKPDIKAKDKLAYKKIVSWIIGKTYTSHNKSRPILKAISSCLKGLKNNDIGLNIGAGGTNYGHAIINLDLRAGKNIDVCGDAQTLPFKNGTFALIISQETLEHIRYHYKAITEMWRVLIEGGTLYCQIPFIIGFHSRPNDFWRFTKEGIHELFCNCGFKCTEIGIAVGPAMGFYRITVEFIAILCSRMFSFLYLPVKGLTALILYPITFLDFFLIKAEQAERIAGGFYIIATKTEGSQNLAGIAQALDSEKPLLAK